MEETKKEKKKKGKDIFRRIILVVCVVVFVYSSYNLLSIYYDYYKIDQSYGNLRTEFIKNDNDKNKYLIIDWDSLLKRNPDVIAWVSIPGTNIDYPVLKGETNDTYLRHDIDHKYSIAGCIFVDANNANPFTDLNTVIYGHHMKNGSMFSDINDYLDADYVKDHPNVYIYLPDGTVSKYKIVSGHKIDATDTLYNTNVQDIKEYYQKMLSGSVFNIEFDQEAKQPVITLSTCATYSLTDTSRAVIHAVLERKGIDPKSEKIE